jgi:O-antigen ligase
MLNKKNLSIFASSYKNKRKYYLLNNVFIHKFFWFLLIFFPSLKQVTLGTSLSQKIMHLFLIIFFVIITLLKKNNIILNKKYLLFIFFILSYTFSITLFTSSNIILKDFGDPIRPIIYFIYFIFPMVFILNNEEFKNVFNFIILLLFIQILFSSFVFIDILSPLEDLYKGRMSNDIIPFHYFRWSGTFIYPSDFSFFLSFFIYFYYMLFVNSNEKVKYFFIFSILVFSLIMTLSRGGIFTVIGMLGIFFGYQVLRNRKLLFKTILIIIILIFTIFLLKDYILSIPSIESQVQYLTLTTNSGKTDDSTGHRILEFKIAIEYLINYFPFGAGPNRLELSEKIAVIESLYGYYFTKWGFFGFLFYLISVMFFSIRSLKLYKNSDDYKIKYFALSFLLLTISVPLLFGFSSAVSDRFKGLPFYYVFSGYIVYLSYYNKIKFSRNKNV